MYLRSLKLPKQPKISFFLWGPRQVGKTSLLEKTYPNANWIQLLHSELYAEYSTQPQLLRERAQLWGKKQAIVIDEVQRVPELLHEIHYLIEQGYVFVLCGSSARKLRRGSANLLGGRAIRYELRGMTSNELGNDFNLKKIINKGYMPHIYKSKQSQDLKKSYIADYLKEEVFSEGLVRKLAPFSQFLELAALSDTEQVSYESFARDVSKSASTIKSYYEILSDTLLGDFVPAYVFKNKRRVKKQPKFYFFDVGIVNHLASRGNIEMKSSLFGKAFENWVYHELKSYLTYKNKDLKISYWALSSGVEVDFIIGHMNCSIEVKSSSKINSTHLKGLRELKVEYPEIKKRYVISTERESRETADGIHILSHKDFTEKLWSGKIIK